MVLRRIQQLLRNSLRIPLVTPSLIQLSLLYFPALLTLYSTQTYFRDFIAAKHDRDFLNLNHHEVFDFIVVGGGSAGAIVANRLSKYHRVLLLEAGGDPDPLSSIPVAGLAVLGIPGDPANQRPFSNTWDYSIVPQKHSCFSMKNNATFVLRGKGLGGSSVVNAMMYLRGSPYDYDNWANITGDSTWTYANLLPFFKKIETYDGPSSKYRGTSGPTHIERTRYAPGADNFITAGREQGFKVLDSNGFQAVGFSYLDVNMRKGVRETTYKSYLKPILSRKNLKIYRYSIAIKIHLDKRRHAYGLTYIRHGIQKFVRTTKEIIISAGALESPKLLMLSGIGPKPHLHSVGLKCRVNLPVGQGLQDHIWTTIGPLITVPEDSFQFERDIHVGAILNYFRNGSGPLATALGNGALAFFASSKSRNPKWPDLFLISNYMSMNTAFIDVLIKGSNFTPEPIKTFLSNFVGQNINNIVVTLGRPKSTGQLLLRTKNPFDRPIIDPRYLSHNDDVVAMIEGAKFAINIFKKSENYRKLGARLTNVPFPSCEGYVFRSDQYWECYVRHLTFPQYHTTSTCRMGRRWNDSRAVVDPKLRVLKTNGLRVIDLGVAPRVTNGNTHAPAMVIGEVGSHLVREYWAEQYSVCTVLEGLSQEYYQKQCHYSRLT